MNLEQVYLRGSQIRFRGAGYASACANVQVNESSWTRSGRGGPWPCPGSAEQTGSRTRPRALGGADQLPTARGLGISFMSRAFGGADLAVVVPSNAFVGAGRFHTHAILIFHLLF